MEPSLSHHFVNNVSDVHDKWRKTGGVYR